MLSLPDFQHRQILFIESYELKDIAYQNDNLVIKIDGKVTQKVPFHHIFAILIIGNCTLTSVFINKCQRYGVIVSLLTKNFGVYAVIGGETEGNFLLREKQYFSSNNLDQAKWVIRNKMQNQLQLLKNIRQKSAAETQAIRQFKSLLRDAEKTDNAASLRGIEGNGAKIFFQTYFASLNWHGRKPRTKYDPPNVLLDIGYTYLFQFIDALLRLYGFDRYKGFYHTEFYQRQSLTCDLVEPFRCLIDQALRKAVNLKQYDETDFEVKNHQYKLKRGNGKKYAQIFLTVIMERKEEIFTFIQTYYRQIMKGQTDYPEFNI